MNVNTFTEVIVIGYGVVTGKVLSYVDEKSSKNGYSVAYIEHEIYPFNSAKKYAERKGVPYQVIIDRDELTDYFIRKANQGKILVVSASNNYLFPKCLVDNTNVTIVNFHNALLPKLPGRNAPSWAIYEKYNRTGITWHYVTSGIDDGDIIIQKECHINDDAKAYELVATLMDLAGKAFEEIFEDILNGKVDAAKQNVDGHRRIYKSYDVPGNGVFEITDDAVDIYRLLRAMDYGKIHIFPLPKTIYKGQEISIKRYKKITKDDIQEADDKLYLPIDTENVLMLKFELAK